MLALRTFRFNQMKSKADLFNTMHTKLLDLDIQLGRAHLSDIKKPEHVSDMGTEEFRLVNRALAHYDTLAMYALKGDVTKQDVLETWGLAMHKRADNIHWFIEARAAQDEYTSWPHLRQLLQELKENPPQTAP